MCFRDRKRHLELESKTTKLEFHTTRYNVVIPILVSLGAFCVEIYSVYCVNGETVNLLNILRLFNTTFIPTHIATTVVFLYQLFSLSNMCKIRRIDDMELEPKYAGFTTVITIILALTYLIFSFKVNFLNQIILIVMQFCYMFLLGKYSIRDNIIIYEEPVKNVVSY